MLNKRKALPWKRRQRKLILTFAILVVVPLLSILTTKPYFHYRAEKEDARLRALGFPASFDEVRAWLPAKPKIQDKEPGFAAAMESLFEAEPESAYEGIDKLLEKQANNKRHSEALRELITGYVAHNGAAFEMLRKAAASSDCGFTLDPRAEFPRYVYGLYRAAYVSALQAQLAAEEGRSQEAADGILTLLSATRLFDGEIHEMLRRYRYLLHRTAVQMFEKAWSFTTFSEAQLQAFQTAFKLEDEPDAVTRFFSLQRMYAIERDPKMGTFSEELMKDTPLYRKSPAGAKAAMYILDILGWNARDEVRYRHEMNTLIAASSKPYAELRKTEYLVQEHLGERHSGLPQFSRSLLANAIHLACTIFDERAYMGLAETAAAVERYRLRNGHLPDKLADLVPAFMAEVRLDPFDGAPLRYQPKGNGYLLYSVGDDMKDDTANAKDKEINPHARQDIVFVVERPQ